ncbi:kinesin-II 85 kDa subunit-like [Rhopilema esculentum]|uniref:kinesin-II 85 kDa subunit-like n=1 Tax=Rhopilema esculentum TaxID=499914 RepID=UPI0031DF2D6A|eukprot:gene4623-20897_t
MVENEQPVQVVVRCRPITDNEKSRGATRVVKISGDRILLHNPYPTSGVKEHNFAFGHCYFWDTKTDQVYKELGETLLRRTLEGYNSTVLAYGQVGSGKTHTLTGSLEEPGLLALFSQALAKKVEESSKEKRFFMTVSFAEISDECVRDLLNPSGRDLRIRKHPQLGTYIDDIAELTVSTHEDIVRLHEQGNKVSKFTVSDFEASRAKASTVFTLSFEQKAKGKGEKQGLLSRVSFIDLAGSNHSSQSEDSNFVSKSIASLSSVISTLNNQKSSTTQYRESSLTKLLQDALGGNSFTTFLLTISPSDSEYYESLSTLQAGTLMQNIKTVPRINQNDNTAVISELREKINRLRDKMAGTSGVITDMPEPSDVERMEELIKDLQIAKLQTWEEKERLSEMYEEERRHHLSNKGILDWVLDSMKKESKEIQQRLATLQKEKDKLMIDYKEKRKVVDDLKDVLQNMITEYSKLTEIGKAGDDEGKKKVAEIHSLKEQLKQESEQMKKLKQQLKDIQEKQKSEKEEAKSQTSGMKGNWDLLQKLETEQREKLEKENIATLADEMDRIKIESEQEKADLKMKVAHGSQYNEDQALKIEMELIDLKAEKSVMAIKLKSLEAEKKQIKKDLEEVYKRHKEEQELQQLQHFQTFRNYREVFEEQRASLEQRYRALLEDSIQDAIFLSSRNQELIDENQNLRQEIADLRDQISMSGERPTSPLSE